MQKPKRGQRLQVQVEKLSIGGRGVARHSGLVIFVDGAAPQETLEVELTHVKKNFAEARIVAILSPSQRRITPPCPVADICGGCSWQHISYSEQLRQKRLLVREALQKFSGFHVDDSLVADPIPSPKEFRYRNRIQLHHSGNKIGFFKRGSHEIVDIDDCPITDERIAAKIPEFRSEYSHRKAGRFEVFLTESGTVERREGARPVDLDKEDQSPEAAGVAFSQVNTQQNIQLVTHVLSLASMAVDNSTRDRHHVPDQNTDRHFSTTQTQLLELYAGSGNFTFPLAHAKPELKITAVELSTDAVRRGEQRAVTEELHPRMRFVESDVFSYLERQPPPPDSSILLDPPRTGAGLEVMKQLAQSSPRSLIYVGCHPVTLARDLSAFSNDDYDLVSVQPFDMFPQTDHIETVVFLRRKTSQLA